PSDYHLVALAMQEPQYRSPGVRELLAAVAKAKVPCMSIMNMPPLTYLKRIPGIDADALRSCYTDASVWDVFDPKLVTLCSPDPQAFRPPEEKVNVLQVRLDQLQVSALRFGVPHRHPPPARIGHRSGPLRRDRAARQAQGARLDFRATREVGHGARRQLPLRAEGQRAPHQGSRAQRPRSVALRIQLGGEALREPGCEREGPGALRKVRPRGALAPDSILRRA